MLDFEGLRFLSTFLINEYLLLMIAIQIIFCDLFMELVRAAQTLDNGERRAGRGGGYTQRDTQGEQRPQVQVHEFELLWLAEDLIKSGNTRHKNL